MSQWTRDGYILSDDPAQLDFEAMHAYLSQAYWSEGIPFGLMVRAVENSLPFGLYHDGAQIGFCRVITDRATFGYLADVYVLEAYRRRGLAEWMMRVVHDHPSLQGFRRWVLLTRDAHPLYRKIGYSTPAEPQTYMEWRRRRSYTE